MKYGFLTKMTNIFISFSFFNTELLTFVDIMIHTLMSFQMDTKHISFDRQFTFCRKQAFFNVVAVFLHTDAFSLTGKSIRWKTAFQLAVDSIISFFADCTIQKGTKKNVPKQVCNDQYFPFKVKFTNKKISWNCLITISIFYRVQLVKHIVNVLYYIHSVQ